MNIEKDYLWICNSLLPLMRLILEGAIVLYEGDASPIVMLIQKAGKAEAHSAFDTIGRALYDLRDYVIDLEKVCRKAAAVEKQA